MRARSMGRRLLALGLLMVLAIGTACADPETAEPGGGTEESLDEVSFMLGIFPQAIHAPYYLGDEKGFFEEAGIDIEILPGESTAATLAAIEDGSTDFGSVDFPTLAVAKTQQPDLTLRTVAMTYATAPYAFYSLASKGNVRAPEDLSGKTAHFPAGSTYDDLLMKWLNDQGVDDATFKEVDPATREQLLLAKELDVISAYISSKPALEEAAAKQGDELVTMLPTDHGLMDIYASGIVGEESFIEENRDLTERFLGAFVKSCLYAFENPEEAGEAMEKAVPTIPAAQTVKVMALLEDLMTANGEIEEPGVVEPERVAATIDYLSESMAVDVNPEDLYLPDLVP